MRREDIRKERARERERERRLEAKDAHGFKKSKLTRDRDRDVSEKMALGQVCCPPPLTSFGLRDDLVAVSVLVTQHISP